MINTDLRKCLTSKDVSVKKRVNNIEEDTSFEVEPQATHLTESPVRLHLHQANRFDSIHEESSHFMIHLDSPH